MAFIRERQPEVLAEAVRQLSTCSREELPAVAHAISGNLGSYQLLPAHAAVTSLREVLADPSAAPTDVDEAWSRTLESLRAQESGSFDE